MVRVRLGIRVVIIFRVKVNISVIFRVELGIESGKHSVTSI